MRKIPHMLPALSGGQRTWARRCAADTAHAPCTIQSTAHISTPRARETLQVRCVEKAAYAPCGDRYMHALCYRLYSVNVHDAHMLGSSHTLNPSDRLRCILPIDTLQTL